MKITDAGIIQSGEEELINRIIEKLEWSTIADILKAKYGLTLDGENIAYRKGDLVVHQGQVAYKLDFEVKVALSVMVDRKGECFDVVTSVTAERGEGKEGRADADSGQDERSIITGGDRSGMPASGPSLEIPGAGETGRTGRDGATLVKGGSDGSDIASQIADMIAEINNP